MARVKRQARKQKKITPYLYNKEYKKLQHQFNQLMNKAKKTTTSKIMNKVGIKRRRYYTRYKGVGGRAINVKNDKDVVTRTYYKQKVTQQQQKIINKRFKNGYSPFKDCYINTFQETIPQTTGKCKWLWRCNNHLELLSKAFAYFPEFSTTTGARSVWNRENTYQNSPEQTVYYNQFKYSYEIYNPTNYDMNLVIYDIVCKQDTTNSCASQNYNVYNDPNNASARNPIRLIELGLEAQYGEYTIAEQTAVEDYPIVADSNAKTLHDINLKPTESYPFNIYFTIVKKHTYKLQPGATLHHKFIHKPKALVNRGYWGYRYGKDMEKNDGDSRRGIKDITSGVLFKYWGQVAGTGHSSLVGPDGTGNYSNASQVHTDVTTLSGRIVLKEEYQAKWDCMDQKFTYTFNNTSIWKPRDEEELEVIGDDVPIKVDDEDISDDTDEGT